MQMKAITPGHNGSLKYWGPAATGTMITNALLERDDGYIFLGVQAITLLIGDLISRRDAD